MKWKIIKTFSVKNQVCFRYQDVIAEFPGKNPVHLSRTLADMVRTGMLLKLFRDVYHIVPLREEPQTYSPDSQLIAGCMMKGKAYYIGYSSAMQIVGLLNLPCSETVIVTRKQVKPSIQTIAGKEFRFVTHTFRRFFGYQKMWVTYRGKAMVSDLEKTIVDALSRPGLCGGILVIARAIYRSHERTDQEKLFYYFARNGSHAAKKSYLYISDTLEMKWTSEHERMLKATGSGISLLDPSGPDRGAKKSRFGLKINIEPGSLKKSSWN